MRLGKKTEDSSTKPRLLRVTLENVEVKKQILMKAKHLRDSVDGNLSKVFISPDLTPKEREANRKLREELKARRDQGENVVIRNGKIVDSKSSFRPRGRIESASLQGAVGGMQN